MSQPIFGYQPFEFTLPLSSGSDYSFTLQSTPAWPTGTSIELRFATDIDESKSTVPVVVWPATITGANATWNVAASNVQIVLDTQARYVKLRYIDSSVNTLVWGKGVVRAS